MDIDVIRKLFNCGKWHACIESGLKFIKHNRTHIEAWSLCALSYGNLGKINEAIECLQEALKIDKQQGAKHKFHLSLNLAEFYRRNNMTLKAIALLKSFLPRDDENLHFNLAKCYGDLQDYEQSINHYTIAITINPKDVHAIFNLANQQAAIGRFNLALKYYTLAYENGMGDAGINLAQIYASLDYLDNSIVLYRDLESRYLQDSNFYFNYANTLRYSLDFAGAKQAYYKALSLHNDPRYAINLAYLLLSLDDFDNGFPLYEHRRALIGKNMPKHFLDFSFQNKEDVLNFLKDKRVLVYHEQGFGDSIMFVRFLPLLECKEKILCVPKELVSLFMCFGISCSSEIREDYDIALPIPSLAFLFASLRDIQNVLLQFRTILHNFLQATCTSPYIQHQCVNADRSQEFVTNNSPQYILKKSQDTHTTSKVPLNKILQSYSVDEIVDTTYNQIDAQLHSKDKNINLLEMPFNHSKSITNHRHKNVLSVVDKKKIKVALNFASNPNFQYAREKSIYPQKLLEALPKDNFAYFSMQYEGIDSDIANEFCIIDLKDCIKDFFDSTTLLMQMDFVISIDSAIAHLSATLGIPTAVLLYKRHDWRWGRLGKHDSTIWYGNNVHLFIQEELHEWGSVLEDLRNFMLTLQ